VQLVAKRVDDHHFRLELSTQAGTYVKEFVHGDLLRTQPSIASLIGCKANLFLLDCEGIELGATFDTKVVLWNCRIAQRYPMDSEL
jgi:tRNA U54 and U55 pseudouridine synthase Pus10